MTTPGGGSHRDPDDPERVVIRDKRRIDPETGEPRAAASSDADDEIVVESNGLGDALGASDDAPAGSPEPELTVTREMELEVALAERTADLQRAAADFANYRRRMERDREVSAQAAVAKALSSLLPVLDDVDRARAHGDLTGALKAVADGLENALVNAGVEAFGTEGDEFDPAVHEAVTHDTSAEVDRPTASMVMRKGYRIGERLLRPAMVGVTAPE